jgi:hypothetical protein
MEDFNLENGTMMWDPNIEESIRAQHRGGDDYQNFKLERTDLLSAEERKKRFST